MIHGMLAGLVIYGLTLWLSNFSRSCESGETRNAKSKIRMAAIALVIVPACALIGLIIRGC
jgi:hypothetical protein